VGDHVAQRIARLALEVGLENGLHSLAKVAVHVVEHKHQRVVNMHVNVDYRQP